MAVREATRLDSPLQSPNARPGTGQDILSAATQIMSWPPDQGSLRFAAAPFPKTVLNGSSRVRQCRTFVPSLGKLAVVAVFLRSQVIFLAGLGDGSTTLTPMPGRFHAGLPKGNEATADARPTDCYPSSVAQLAPPD